MIELTINKHTYRVPSRWDECDAATFRRLARAMWNFEMGHTDFETFRIEIPDELVRALRQIRITREVRGRISLVRNLIRCRHLQ